MASMEDHEFASDDGEEGDHNGSSTTNVKQVRSSRACIACRRMKTRCEVDEALGTACKLCIRARRECVMQAIPRRRKRKTTDRVADLERKINSLTALLSANESKGSVETSPASAENNPSSNSKTRVFESDDQEPPAISLIDEVLESELIDWDMASAAFDRYKTEMCQYLPFVVFPATADARFVKEQQPLLFFSIVAAAIGSANLQRHKELSDRLTKDLALRIMYRGERSLEILQAITVHIMFYSRSKQMKELNFNQMVNIACTMGLDIGLGRRSHVSFSAQKQKQQHLESLAGRRAWLACYYMSTAVAMSLRHPPALRWSVYVEECIEVLSSETHAAPTDAWLCDLVRLQHIAEDASFLFSMDDPGSIVTLSEAKTQYQIGLFRSQLEQWRRNSKTNLKLPHVRHSEATATLYIHEIALHSEHNIDDLRLPSLPPIGGNAGSVENVVSSLGDLQLAPARVESLFTCLSAIHSAFDAILSMDLSTLGCIPNIYIVRTGYAARSLRKLAVICEAQSRIKGGFNISSRDLKFDEYLDSLIDLLARVGTEHNSEIARAFSMVLKQVKVNSAKSTDPSQPFDCPKDMPHPTISSESTVPGSSVPTTISPQSSTESTQLPLPEFVQNPTTMPFSIQPNFSASGNYQSPTLGYGDSQEYGNWPQADPTDPLMYDVMQWVGPDFVFDDYGFDGNLFPLMPGGDKIG